MKRTRLRINALWQSFLSCVLVAAVSGPAAADPLDRPLLLAKQGSFFVGGGIITAPGDYDINACGVLSCPTPAGQTLHTDHAYVRYQIPLNPRKLPLVMWHGCLSTAWESTPDDREGYESIMVRKGFPTYIIDQPRQGRAGKSSVGTTITPTPSDQHLFAAFRFGIWPNLFPGVQFPPGPAALDHFFRQGGAGHGPSNDIVSSDAVAALFEKIGPAILITHSASARPGWLTALKSDKVMAIVAYEPGTPFNGQFLFPPGEVPPTAPLSDGSLQQIPGNEVPLDDFMKLTKIPIQCIWGDNIPETPHPILALDEWRLRLLYTRQFAQIANSHGGDVTVLHLPEAGLHGNTHFAFADLNNVQVSDLLSDFLKKKGLDRRGR